MDSSARTNLILGIVIGLVLGLLAGMLLFWGLYPVEWEDANTYDLAPAARAQYVALVADSFRLDLDPARADAYLAQWTIEEKQAAFAEAVAAYEREGRVDKAQAVRDLANALSIPESAEVPPAPEPIEPPGPSLWDRLRVPCLIFVLVLLALVLGLIALRSLRRRQGSSTPPAAAAPDRRVYAADRRTVATGARLGIFSTTYEHGKDTYDESFSIEARTGEFLGECGMGISETMHNGEPDKVMAFEVWLFDKSDIRTVTKVLMSEHAFGDQALRAKLAPKGEAVLAEIGRPILLETTGLQVQVNVTDLDYGDGSQPANSYFDRLVVELVAAARPAEDDAA
jgi:hypothetical protein